MTPEIETVLARLHERMERERKILADISSEENMQASGVIHIPTRCIKKIVPLEER